MTGPANELAWIGLAIAGSLALAATGGWWAVAGLLVGWIFTAGFYANRRFNEEKRAAAPRQLIVTRTDLQGRDYVFAVFSTDQEAQA